MAYSQNDPAWKNYTLGFGPGNIGLYGCFLTSFANVCRWAGRDINPAQLNATMKNRGWFSGDLVTNRQVPTLLYPDSIEWAGERHWVSTTDMNHFNDASDPNVAYIIWIDASAAPGVQSHFTMVWAKNGDDLIIDDSWDGQRKSLKAAYGHPPLIIQAAYKFRKKAVNPPTQQPVTGDPDMARPTRDEVVQAYANISGANPDEGTINFHTQNSTYKSLVQGFFNNNDTAIARLRATEGELGALRGQMSALQNTVSELQAQLTQRPTLEAIAEVETKLADAQKELEAAKAELENAKNKPALWDKNTPIGKTLRTFAQSLGGLYSTLLAISQLPEVQMAVAAEPSITALPVFASAIVAAWTYAQNKIEEKKS